MEPWVNDYCSGLCAHLLRSGERLQSRHCLLQMSPLMKSGYLGANAELTSGHCKEAETSDRDSLLQHAISHLLRYGSLTGHHWYSGVIAGNNLNTGTSTMTLRKYAVFTHKSPLFPIRQAGFGNSLETVWSLRFLLSIIIEICSRICEKTPLETNNSLGKWLLSTMLSLEENEMSLS